MSDMRPYVIRPGDYLSSLAQIHGFDPQAVWQHAANRELRELRDSPEILAPGDVLHIPNADRSRHSLSVGGSNSFTTAIEKVTVVVALCGSDGNARANAQYWVDGDDEPAGTTDGEGKATIEVPATQRSISLVVEGCDDSYLLQIAHLDPVATESGLRQRLVNLRYLPEDGEHITPERLGEALRRFQRDNDLDDTGEPDDATRRAIVAEHGS